MVGSSFLVKQILLVPGQFPPLCVSLVNTSKQSFAYISFWNFESPVDFIWICVIQRGTFINLLYECAHVCLWPLESKRGHQTPQSLSYR